MMDPLLLEKRPAIEALCRAYGVQRLYVFGSAATGTRRADSDFDFSVVCPPEANKTSGLGFFRFINDLQALIGRKIDVVDELGIRNPYFRSELTTTKGLLYAAPSD
jgi:uncharacterized protein